MNMFLSPIENPRACDEAGLFFYPQAVRQSLDPAKSAFRAIASRLRVVLRKNRPTRQKADTAAGDSLLIREQVARLNVCLFGMDIGRFFAIKAMMKEAKFDALDQYRTSTLFIDAERAAPDYVTELTRDKEVNPDTFARMTLHYSEREICEIVWLVASEHLYNVTNIGLNIHSDMLCNINKKRKAA